MPTLKLLSKISFLVVGCLLLVVGKASAQEEFNVIYNTAYEVDSEGKANVEQKISLTNNFSKIYASSYSLKLEGKKPENIKAVSGKTAFATEFKETDSKYEIVISFPEALVGKGKTREFVVSYEVPQIAVRNGKVWEVSIPKLSSPELISEYNLSLKVPNSFGIPAYISPEPRNKTSQGSFQNFEFRKDDLTKAGVVATFGDFQVFSFNLTYHLENNSGKELEQEIALVPDTAFQRVYYESLIPEPVSVRRDEDGNWLAKYDLRGNTNLVVTARVAVDVYSQPQEHYSKIDPANYYLEPTEKWQTTDTQILTLAKTLKTPRAIYDFVVGKLNYDYNRVREGVERYGAKKALDNPDEAICMEFTDLFIGIARAAGIPAREVNGYAYTENPELQPLSLVADVLHAWPEYWDDKKKIWRPVDPTWEDTTGGIDFFDKFDLSHVAFAIHGKSIEYPAPAGSYKEQGNQQKDIVAEFGTLNELRSERAQINIIPQGLDLPFVSNKYTVKVKNDGPVAIYSQQVVVKGGSQKSEQAIELLIPYSTAEVEISAKSPLFPFFESNKLQVSFGEASAEYSLSNQNILISRIALFLLLILLVLSVALSPRIYLRLISFAGRITTWLSKRNQQI